LNIKIKYKPKNNFKMRNLLIALAFLLPLSVFAQKQMVGVGNSTNSVIQVDGVDIASRVLKNVNLTVIDGIAHFSVKYYDQNRMLIGPINLTRPVVSNRIRIDNFDQMPESSRQREQRSQPTPPAPPPAPSPPSLDQSTDWWAYVTVRPQNKLEGYSIFVPTEPFRGLALKPDQISERVVTLRTGEIIFPVFMVAEDETDSQTGVKYSWAIVNKIVTEGQDNFLITPQDVMEANTGRVVRKRMISRLNFDFIISEGASKGIVVSPQTPQRLDFYVGWNIIPIQFKDPKGLPTQAILIILVNDARGNVFARSKTASDVSVGQDNIVITNTIR